MEEGHCEHRGPGDALSPAVLRAQLHELPDWKLEHGAIERAYQFDNYYATIAFVNAIAWVINHEDHHPELAVSYDRCGVRFSTHSANGISQNDCICAAKCDAIYAAKKASSA